MLYVSRSRAPHESWPGIPKDVQTPQGALAEPCGPCHVSALSSDRSGEILKSSGLSYPPARGCSSPRVRRGSPRSRVGCEFLGFAAACPKDQIPVHPVPSQSSLRWNLFLDQQTVLLAPTQCMQLPSS